MPHGIFIHMCVIGAHCTGICGVGLQSERVIAGAASQGSGREVGLTLVQRFALFW